MNRALLALNLILLACLGVFWGLNASLEVRREAQRLADSAFHTLSDKGPVALAAVTSFELKFTRSRHRWRYVRRAEGWRIPQYRDAFALGQEIDGLLRSFLEGQGTIVGHLSADGAHFGLVARGTLEVSFFSEGDRLLLRAQAGRIAPGQRASECFAAADGSDAVLHLDSNPWMFLKHKPGSHFPPLTDARVVPAALGRGLPAKIAFGGSSALAVRELIRKEIPIERRLPLDRGPRFEWYGATAEGEERLNDEVAFGYASFLAGLEYEELLGSPDGKEAALAPPSLTVTLEYDEGTKDVLTLGMRTEKGLRYLLHGTTRQLVLISGENAAKLVPDLKALLEAQPPKEARPAPPVGR